MKPIKVTTNEARTGFHIESDFTRARLHEWMKEYKWFEITPIVAESKNKRRYLEGAVIPEYCKFQYGIDPRDKSKREACRLLFKQDFHNEILMDRNGNPVKVPKSSLGKAGLLLDTFTAWADQNGCKVPSCSLYVMWRDQWSMDFRFEDFQDFLDFLEIDCDAMPSNETLNKLYAK